jgi:glycosyltransferase involved in cell wall biosynthesis
MIFFKYKSIVTKNKKIFKFIRVVSIFLLFLNFYFNNKISSFAKNINYIRECNKIEEYLKYCNNNLIKIKKSNKFDHPKISIISPIYNRGKYAFRFIKSIQNQNFKQIEIIIIDDCSNDETKALIKQYQKEDQRIILIQNKKNKGTFASRNIGALKSRGQYVMIPDPDDILEQNCLHYFYNLAKRNDYELIRFYIYTGKRRIYFGYHVIPLPSIPIYQPELSTYLFYASKFLRQIDYNVSNKFIKREALIRAMNIISNELFIYMTNFEDGVLNYFLYRASKSFILKKKIAYYYIKNRDSITTKGIKTTDIKFIFFHLKFVFQYSKNSKYEKDMFNILFRRIAIWRNIKKKVFSLKNDFNFYLYLIDEFLNNEYINNNNKHYLMQTQMNILKTQKMII